MPEKRTKPIRLKLPATSANLGPAFDAAALALGLFLEVRARPASDFSLRASGRDAETCGRLEQNLMVETYSDILRANHKRVVGLALEVRNEIPVGRGCGSSAAARLAGIALANHFGGLHWKSARIIAEASRREHHPDNASACWLGGVTVARMNDNEVCATRIRVRGRWPLLLAVPHAELSTELARRAVPASYSRADAIANIQNAMLLLSALTGGRPEILTRALDDRLHQPFRAPLCPLLPALQALSGKHGILGAVLSGAGPSVLLFVDPRSSVEKCSKQVLSHLRKSAMQAELLSCTICPQGAQLSYH
jgi:homoserine kinase